jgi:hypothetical protein
MLSIKITQGDMDLELLWTNWTTNKS